MNIIQFLYLLLIAHNTEDYPDPKLKAIADPSLIERWLKEIPSLKEALKNYNKGNDIDLVKIGAELRSYTNNVYAKQPGAKQSFKDLLLTFATYFRSGSESAFKRLAKTSTLTSNPNIAKFFSQEIGDQSSVEDKLKKLVVKLGGDKGKNALTPDQMKVAKSKNPDLAREYLKLRRDFAGVWQNALATFVRDSGNKTVPYQKALKFLESEGLKHSMPSGFTGNIDANGDWYDPDDKPVNGKPASTVFPSVRMNPDYGKGLAGKDWLFVALRSDGSFGNYFYTKEYKAQRIQNKFAVVRKLIAKMSSLRKRWLSQVNGFKPTNRLSVAAVVIELLYQSSNRVGIAGGNKKTGGGFGMCTILCGMVIKTSTGYKIQYQGKDNIKTIFLLKGTTPVNKKLIKIIGDLMDGKKKTDPVFTYETSRGVQKPILPAFVNAYFKSVSGGATVHKLRTYWGTKMFMESLAAMYDKVGSVANPKEGMYYVDKMAKEVGSRLNHVRNSIEGEAQVTPKTALVNYIDPGIQAEFFEHYGLPLPKYLEKLLVVSDAETDRPDDAPETDEEIDQGYDQIDIKLLERHLVGDRTAAYQPLVL